LTEFWNLRTITDTCGPHADPLVTVSPANPVRTRVFAFLRLPFNQKRPHRVDEMMAQIIAERLGEYLLGEYLERVG